MEDEYVYEDFFNDEVDGAETIPDDEDSVPDGSQEEVQVELNRVEVQVEAREDAQPPDEDKKDQKRKRKRKIKTETKVKRKNKKTKHATIKTLERWTKKKVLEYDYE